MEYYHISATDKSVGAAFLCADLAITPEVRDDQAAYIGHWLKALKDDRRLTFSAAAHAQRAVDFLHLPSCWQSGNAANGTLD